MTLNIRQAYSSMEFERVVDTGYFSDGHNALYRDIIKRAMDIAIVMLVAVPVLMVLAVLCVVIAMDGKSPFYTQERVGKKITMMVLMRILRLSLIHITRMTITGTGESTGQKIIQVRTMMIITG